MITFEINAKPFGKERPRFGGGRVYTPAKTSAHEIMIGNLAKTAMKGHDIFTGPVNAKISVVARIPDSWPKWKKEFAKQGLIANTKTPDLDNIQKIVLDSINKIVYNDDSQVNHVEATKIYGSANYTQVIIMPVTGVPCNVKTLKEYKQLIGE